MALLVKTIVPPGEAATYRVNLYILVTLARIQGGWTGTEAERAAVGAIANSSERSDPTYKKWADQAIAAQLAP